MLGGALAECLRHIGVLSPGYAGPVGQGRQPEDIRIAQAVTIELPTGYSRSLVAGSLWREVGSLVQGKVFRPVDSVFSIEGRHVHEAYLVVRQGRLEGFYLPAEKSFSALRSPVPLNLGNPS